MTRFFSLSVREVTVLQASPSSRAASLLENSSVSSSASGTNLGFRSCTKAMNSSRISRKRYLLEDKMSVVNFCSAASELSQDDTISIVADFTKHIEEESLSVCGYESKSLYKQVNSCWEGIFDNMTYKYCNSHAEWPILFGIVLQNIVLMAIDAGAPKKDAGKIAVKCAVDVSKMDKDSFLPCPSS